MLQRVSLPHFSPMDCLDIKLYEFMKRYRIIKILYFTFLGIGIFFTLLTIVKAAHNYCPWMSVIGENSDTLDFYSFWIDVLGTIASFSMVFITAISINLNEKQLTELKRQWEIEHTPYLSCQLTAKKDHFLLRVINTSKVTADKVRVSIDSKLYTSKDGLKEPLIPFQFNELKGYLKTQTFVIPPNESLYFTIWITPYKEVEHLPNGFISVSLDNANDDFGVYELYPQNFAFASFETENANEAIVSAINTVGKKIENKKFTFK